MYAIKNNEYPGIALFSRFGELRGVVRGIYATSKQDINPVMYFKEEIIAEQFIIDNSLKSGHVVFFNDDEEPF